MRTVMPILGVACACLPLFAVAAELAPKAATPGSQQTEAYQTWKAVDDAIQEPLGGLKGDPVNGRKVLIDRGRGNCLACHVIPIPAEKFQGEIGPPLAGLGSRYSEGQIRMRVVNIQTLDPSSLMPPMYKNPAELNRVAKKFQGKTILTAQEVEDVVAYLMTLK
jgi:L-cysteine S-thiosulfotransferase